MVTKYKKCLMEFMCMKNYKTINFIDENISHAKTWKYGSIMCGCRVGEEELNKYYIPPNNIWVKKEKEVVALFCLNCPKPIYPMGSGLSTSRKALKILVGHFQYSFRLK